MGKIIQMQLIDYLYDDNIINATQFNPKIIYHWAVTAVSGIFVVSKCKGLGVARPQQDHLLAPADKWC